MIFATVLATLWRMLDTKRRLIFAVLVLSLFASGVFEMMGMLVIFGFIRGLHADAHGHRHGPVSRILEHAFHGHLDNETFALAGGGLVLVVIAIKNAQALVVRHQLSRFLSNLHRRITETLYAGLLMAPYLDLLTERHGNPQEMIRGNMEVVASCFEEAARILADGALLIMVILLLVLIDPWMTIGAALLFGVAGTLIYRLLAGRLREMGREERAARKELGRYLGESFHGLIETRLRENNRYFVNRFRSALRETLSITRTKRAMERIPRATNELILSLAVTGSVVYMVLSGSDLSSFMPTLAVFGFAGLRSNNAMSRINSALQALRSRADVFERQREALMRIAPQVFKTNAALDAPASYIDEEDSSSASKELPFTTSLTFENVTFSYPEPETTEASGSQKPSRAEGPPSRGPAIQDLSLHIKPGSFVAFCGESGGGKSTLLLLLMGMIKPTSGRILCDGRDIQQHIRAWHRQIGYVGQSLFVSEASVRSNVAFGLAADRIDDAKVTRALRQAAAWDFVAKLPYRARTTLVNNGSRLSGGQRQRIVIARALYHDPPILIFDEATSALDNATEKEITDAIQGLRRTKTVICVAHRLSSIRDADEIFVLRQGKVVAHGAYDELIEQSPYFRQLANMLVTSEAASEAPLPV